MNRLESFLSQEAEIATAMPDVQTKKITYPFAFLEKLTDEEYKYIHKTGYLTGTCEQDNQLGLYILNEGKYSLLGYIEPNFSTIIAINSLMPRELYIKYSKDKCIPIRTALPSFLLTK